MKLILTAFSSFCMFLFIMGCGSSSDKNGQDSADAVYDAADLPEEKEQAVEQEETGVFSYESCADPEKILQFPTPAWEITGDSLTGILLSPPENDAAYTLFLAARPEWAEPLKKIDGIPLNAAWIIALDNEGSSPDLSKIDFFSYKNGKVDHEIPDLMISANVSSDGKSLMIRALRPLPTPEKGEKFIIALYEGIVSGAKPVPACGKDGKAQSEYVAAAKAVIGYKPEHKPLFAIPFTCSRTTAELPALYKAMKKSPQLTVEKIEKRSLDSFGEQFNPPPETVPHLKDPAYKAIISVLLYQDQNGIFVSDTGSEIPKEQGKNKPGILIVLPAKNDPPCPSVIFQHGGSRYKEDLFSIITPYAKAGFAMIGMDLPYHGDLSTHPNNTGSDLDMADFSAPLKTRDNFRQAAANHLSLIAGINAVNDALKPLTGFEKTLDSGKMFYMGHSMGSVSGTLSSSVSDALLGSSLIAGGGPFRQLLSEGFFSLLIQDIFTNHTDVETEVMLNFIQTVLDGGDPVNYPVRAEDHSKQPKDMIIWEAISDPFVNNTATDMQARETGAALVSPYHHDVSGMKKLDLPVSGNFQWDNSVKTSARALWQKILDVPEINLHMAVFLDASVHAVTANCFFKRIQTGSCVIENAEP